MVFSPFLVREGVGEEIAWNLEKFLLLAGDILATGIKVASVFSGHFIPGKSCSQDGKEEEEEEEGRPPFKPLVCESLGKGGMLSKNPTSCSIPSPSSQTFWSLHLSCCIACVCQHLPIALVQTMSSHTCACASMH